MPGNSTRQSGPRRQQGRAPRSDQSPPACRERTAFVADAMLGSLARKLRALGFDTSYYGSGEDSGLVDLATQESRTILTSDRSLASRALGRGLHVILLTEKNDRMRVRQLAKAYRLSGMPLVRGDSLCSVCGSGLAKLGRRDVAGLVPPAVERGHRLFYRCTSCGQIYWRGSHWKKLRSLARQLKV
jgi:uncharacterized protein